MDSIAKTLLCCGLMLIGMAGWVIIERLRIVEPMCLVTDEIYSMSSNK